MGLITFSSIHISPLFFSVKGLFIQFSNFRKNGFVFNRTWRSIPVFQWRRRSWSDVEEHHENMCSCPPDSVHRRFHRSKPFGFLTSSSFIAVGNLCRNDYLILSAPQTIGSTTNRLTNFGNFFLSLQLKLPFWICIWTCFIGFVTIFVRVVSF